MSNYRDGTGGSEDAIWQHLDFYVRRREGQLVLVQTLLKFERDSPDNTAEIITIYFGLDQLDLEWADAVSDQGAALEEGKSCDFVPPDEDINIFHRP